jgi:hypothetical protein
MREATVGIRPVSDCGKADDPLGSEHDDADDERRGKEN